MDQENRIVVLIDMDCFYCQVEEKLNPALKGKPIAVVQYNPWQGGGIIAVNYLARAKGVTRHMRGKEAKDKCPDIELASVPCVRGKADISRFREAGKEVARVLHKFTALLERASIDEAYLDITAPVEERLSNLNINTVNTTKIPDTFALGYDGIDGFLSDVRNYCNDNIDFDYEHAKRLVVGAIIVSEIRAAVFEETGYTCSAGIAHNKILAKLVCGFNKPNKQTILPKHSVNILYSKVKPWKVSCTSVQENQLSERSGDVLYSVLQGTACDDHNHCQECPEQERRNTLPLKKVKHLGGKFGDTVCEMLKISKMGELQKYTEKELQSRFDEKNGSWLYNIARGIDLEPVQVRLNPKSIGCCKQFRGKAALRNLDSLRKWLKDLSDEIEDRLEQDSLENNRTPKQMVVSFSTQMPSGRDTSSSRSYNFVAEDELCSELFCSKALELLIESSEGLKLKENESNRNLKAPIKFLGISVGKFEDNSESKKTKGILDYFSAGSSKEVIDKPKNEKPEKSNSKSTKHGKEYLLQKFFKAADNPPVKLESDIKKCNEVQNQLTNSENGLNNENSTSNNQSVVESTLDEQESFFAKLLNQNAKIDPRIKSIDAEEKSRPITPLCDVVKCEDETNDTDYSGSTIINEIDKSMALFEDDPEEVNRVTSMRQLMNSSKLLNEEGQAASPVPDVDLIQAATVTPPAEPQTVDVFECPECKKSISILEVEMHSDYHVALKLRDEERQQVRQEKQNRTIIQQKSVEAKKKKVPDESSKKNKSMSSIASFLVKIDDSVPTETCAECGKRIPVDKFMEHGDFHEAQKLNRKLNNKISPQFAGSSVKRKRISTSPVKNIKPCISNNSIFK